MPCVRALLFNSHLSGVAVMGCPLWDSAIVDTSLGHLPAELSTVVRKHYGHSQGVTTLVGPSLPLIEHTKKGPIFGVPMAGWLPL